jgi:hypothetical protein
MPDESLPPPYFETHSPNRPGVFRNLDGFIQPPDTYHHRGLRLALYEHLTTANPNVGDIIHILEDDHANTGLHASCLHQRVMLVIRHDKPIKGTCRSLTCVPLCRHISGVETGTAQSHWNVEQVLKDGTRLQNKDDVSHALVIQFCRDTHFLLADITVNLAEPWHVEYEGIKVRDLGKVPQDSLNRVRARVVELFSESVLPKLVAKKETESRKPTARR